ncbi:MAG: hypothetical protein IT441_02050 [Phycisphaeraceae bacterium]|nr:hypothetical protein [Phycisphaeraceae bacterium]
MKHVKHLLEWAKANPMTVGSAAVIVASLSVWVLLVWMPGSRFQADMSKQANAKLSEINQYADASVQIPAPESAGDPQAVQMVINQSAIDKLEWVQQRIQKESQAVIDQAVTFNRGAHRPMLDGLFPQPIRPDLPYTARERYREMMAAMLSEQPNAFGLPHLNAGSPPTPAEITEELSKVDQEINAEISPRKISDLSPAEQREMSGRRSQRLKEFLTRRARGIHVYARREPSAWPLDVAGWAYDARQPKLSEIWRSQMSLWVQQDIVAAIGRVNRVDDPTQDVTTAPVKRLVSIEVVGPGYVGIDNGGTFLTQAGRSSSSSYDAAASSAAYDAQAAMLAEAMRPPDMEGGSLPSASSAVAAAPQGEEPDPTPPAELPPVDYAVSPTGRSSNDQFDVWHARVTVVIDSTRIPQFLDALSKVNFITVLQVSTQDVDEYQDLLQGYVYGPDDVVELTLSIETVWLRAWTASLMPRVVKLAVGVPQPEAEGAAPEGEATN